MDGKALALILMQMVRALPFDRLARKEPDWEQYKSALSAGMSPGALPLAPRAATVVSDSPVVQVKPAAATSTPAIAAPLPTTRETVDELKKRLGREMYRLQLDLVAGGRIAGKPCDCLHKHTEMGLIPIVEELATMDANPVYDQILRWSDEHLPEFTIEAVSQNDPKRYRSLAPSIRNLRKELLGTEVLSSLSSSS